MEEKMIEKLRHGLSHVLAKAVGQIYTDVKYAIGPAIDNGFYYDFDTPDAITPDDFPRIEKAMRHIIANNENFEKKVVSREEALKMFKEIAIMHNREDKLICYKNEEVDIEESHKRGKPFSFINWLYCLSRSN